MEILTIIAILLSPVVAIVIGEYLLKQRMKQEGKDSVLRDLISYRYEVSNAGFLKAFNSIPIVFKDHERIKTLHKEFYDSIKRDDPLEVRDAKLTSVILAICRELGYSKNIEESDIKNILIPKKE